MTPTDRARRSDALYYDTQNVARRSLCDMIAQRESDLEELRKLARDLYDFADLAEFASDRDWKRLADRMCKLGVAV